MRDREEMECRVVMLRLGYSADIRTDSRVLREASSLSKRAKVEILDIVDGSSTKRFVIDKIRVRLVPLLTKRLPKKTSLELIKYFEYFLRTLMTLLTIKVDVVHAHDLDTLPVGFVGARLKGAKIIYDAHELFTEMDGKETIVRKLWRRIERFLLPRTDGVIAAVESRAEIMHSEYGASELPTVVMNIPERTEPVNSVLLREFVTARGAPYGQESKIILYQGNFSPQRGLEELIRAFANLPDSYVLVLMGYGALKQCFLGITEELMLTNRVFLHEAVPSKNLHPYTCSADLGVITYKNTCRNKYCCAPNKMFEYMMAGLPVVGADLPEIRKVVTKYRVGSLFDPENEKSIAEAISAVLKNESVYNVMRKNVKDVVNDFSWSKEENKLHELYRRINCLR